MHSLMELKICYKIIMIHCSPYSKVAECPTDLGKGPAKLMHINLPAKEKFLLRRVFVSSNHESLIIVLASVDGAMGQKKRMLGNQKMKLRVNMFLH